MELTGEKIESKKVSLDGNTFIRCEISDSVLVYKGGALPVMKECQINDCQWSFAEEAANTLQFMAAMYSGMGLGGMDIIDQTISNIRNNAFGAEATAASKEVKAESQLKRKNKKTRSKKAAEA